MIQVRSCMFSVCVHKRVRMRVRVRVPECISSMTQLLTIIMHLFWDRTHVHKQTHTHAHTRT